MHSPADHSQPSDQVTSEDIPPAQAPAQSPRHTPGRASPQQPTASPPKAADVPAWLWDYDFGSVEAAPEGAWSGWDSDWSGAPLCRCYPFFLEDSDGAPRRAR